MRNWLGQEINVGDYVYRGARDGNSSTFKLGKVTDIGKHVRVHWLYENGARWAPGYKERIPCPRTTDSYGRPGPESLFVIDPAQAKALIESIEEEIRDYTHTL